MIRQALERRYRNGPVCGRCKNSDLTPDEIPDLTAPPPQQFRITTCQAISLNSRAMQISATSGKNCHHFRLDPKKAC